MGVTVTHTNTKIRGVERIEVYEVVQGTGGAAFKAETGPTDIRIVNAADGTSPTSPGATEYASEANPDGFQSDFQIINQPDNSKRFLELNYGAPVSVDASF